VFYALSVGPLPCPPPEYRERERGYLPSLGVAWEGENRLTPSPGTPGEGRGGGVATPSPGTPGEGRGGGALGAD